MLKYMYTDYDRMNNMLLHDDLPCGFYKFQTVTQMDFMPWFSSCHKYISFDVNSDIVYEKNMLSIKVSSVFIFHR